MSIKVQNISKNYGKQKALDDVSFTINTGEVVGFIGPNGAGKTTMMKIITGFIPQTEGTVLVNDLNTLEHSLEIRRRIGYLPENNPLYLDMYVKEYLKMVGDIYKAEGRRQKAEVRKKAEGRSRAKGRSTAKGRRQRVEVSIKLQDVSKRVDEMIDMVGLDLEKHKKIGALSKGFRQRVGLAQALIHDPDVLILDEPTSGLDPNQIVGIRDFIAELGKDKTVMLSTHIMQEVQAICDRVIIINLGRVVADDPTEKIQSQNLEAFQTIEMEFEEVISGNSLKQIHGVVKVKKIDSKHFLLEGKPNRDIRSDIFQWAVKNKVTVLKLAKREKSLEEVFQELTK